MRRRSAGAALAIALLILASSASIATAQENLEEDALAARLCGKALEIVIGWGAGKVLDHYAAQQLEAKLDQLDAALRNSPSSQWPNPAALNVTELTRRVLFDAQQQNLTASQWNVQTANALSALHNLAQTRPPISASTAPLLNHLDLGFARAKRDVVQDNLLLSPVAHFSPGRTLMPSPIPAAPATTSTECSPAADAQYLPRRDLWYSVANGDAIEYITQGGFVVWNGHWNYFKQYPDPTFSLTRNLWHHLLGSPFSVCVDKANRVFALYTY